MLRRSVPQQEEVRIVLNLAEEMKRLVPAN